MTARTLRNWLWTAGLMALLWACLLMPLWGAVSQVDGWTVVTESGDTRKVYVSSTGSDANDGLSDATPKQTIAAGMALIRDGYPDWLLLKRGDTWSNVNDLSYWDTSGRSETEPQVVGAYGTGNRPYIQSNTGRAGFAIQTDDNLSYIMVQDLHFKPYDREAEAPGANNPTGVKFQTGAAQGYFWLEGCLIDGYSICVDADGKQTSIRRNVIINAWSDTTHAQGIYAAGTKELLIEENFLDHNGWHETIANAGASSLAHNMYITHGTRDVTIRKNIVSRGSSMGCKFQPVDGTHYIDGNIFNQNGYGLQAGGGKSPEEGGQIESVGIIEYVNDNIIIEGKDNGATTSFGVTVSNVDGGQFRRNLIANKIDGGQPAMLVQDGATGWESDGVGVRNMDFSDNVIYNWRGRFVFYGTDTDCTFTGLTHTDNIHNEPNFDVASDEHMKSFLDSGISFSGNTYYQHDGDTNDDWFSQGSSKTDMTYAQWVTATGETGSSVSLVNFTDATRTLTTYATSELGLANYDEFVTNASALSRENWDTDYTAVPAGNWIREGFDMDPYSGPVSQKKVLILP